MKQRRAKSKEVRELVKRLERHVDVQQVTTTRNGRVRVVGPKGIAIFPSMFGSPRGRDNALMTLATYAGIDLRRGCEA